MFQSIIHFWINFSWKKFTLFYLPYRMNVSDIYNNVTNIMNQWIKIVMNKPIEDRNVFHRLKRSVPESYTSVPRHYKRKRNGLQRTGIYSKWNQYQLCYDISSFVLSNGKKNNNCYSIVRSLATFIWKWQGAQCTVSEISCLRQDMTRYFAQKYYS